MDHVGLLLNITELNTMLNESTSLTAFLDRCIAIVADHFSVEVCSIYLFDPIQKCLNLASTRGLTHNTAYPVSLKLGEGLTGLCLQELRPIMTPRSSQHPNYRHFPRLNEEKFDAYLGVPIVRGIIRIGVLVIQRESSRPFDESDQVAMQGVANQLAAMIDYTRLLIARKEDTTEIAKEKPALPRFIKGRSASAGWALGRVVKSTESKDLRSFAAEKGGQKRSLAEFDEACAKTIDQLLTYQKKIGETLSDVASLIFASHILLLKDEQFVGAIRQHIRDGADAVESLIEITEQFIAVFTKHKNPYLRQKVDDIRDVALRVLENLCPGHDTSLAVDGNIVIASQLVPSDILILSVEKAAGVLLIGGGVTSHVAILARSLKLPMVLADMPDLLNLPDTCPVLLDAETGNVFIDPQPSVIAPYEQRRKRKQTLAGADAIPRLPKTADGVEIDIFANVNLISDSADARAVFAKGIGLYRTEFPFMIRNAFPVEEEQYVVYRKLIENMRGSPVTFRTLDIGGDKALSYYNDFVEHNPFLGMRSIRFCIGNRDVFKSQIRAILRAGEGADLRIMFPMISSVDELETARAIIDECKEELTHEHARFHTHPSIGVMIELPSAVEMSDALAMRCDFFSIGTNDLIQYTLAVDRTNEKVASFYCAHHPAVLRAVNRAADTAFRRGIGVSVCGDMAHEGRYLDFLIGIGIRTISIDPLFFPSVCETISHIDASRAATKAQSMLDCVSIAEVDSILSEPS